MKTTENVVAITIEIDGEIAATAQGYELESDREPSQIFSGNSCRRVGDVSKYREYLLTLTNAYPTEKAIGGGVDFLSCDKFNVVIETLYSCIIYSDCEWLDIQEKAPSNGSRVGKIKVITSKRKEVPFRTYFRKLKRG